MYNVHDVFISYRREEADGTEQGSRIAFAIYDYLTKKGLRVFLDKERMENGPFPEQLQWQLNRAPNYIFIATNNAMAFRQVKTPEKDYVAEEVRLALQQFKENPNDRMLLVVKPSNAPYPEKSDPTIPPEIIQLFDHRVLECKGEYLEENDPVLKDILTNVTEVKRRNLWNAGSRWLEEAKKDGHRFANLHIDQTIMPQAGIHTPDNARFPIHAHLEDLQDAPLMDMIKDTPGHLYLIGEGGIGKTTALFSIIEYVYGPGTDEKDIDRNRMNGQVPLFIELSKAPDTYGRLYEGGKSTFIRRAVYQQLRTDLKVKQVSQASVEDIQEVFNLDPDTAVKPVMDLFTHQSLAPEYLLLLDGLNEVSRTEIGYTVRDGDGTERKGKSSIVFMVLQEIKDLMTDCPNVRIILTSRSREQTNWSDKTTMLHLSGVKEEAIEEYLRDRKLPESRITAAIQNEKLREILRVPLFLTLYAALEGTDEILTRGEILHLFFHQKKEQLYTAKNRNAAVNEDVRTAASAIQPNRLTADMQSFILDFILPEIAWRMEQDSEFYIQQKGKNGKEGLRQIILRVLTDRSETSVCGENGKDAFTEYGQHFSNNNTRKTAKALCKRLRGDVEDEEDAEDATIDGILENVVFSLGILQKNSGANGMEYGFIHHHFRDYFAAVHQINRLRLAVYLHTFGEDDLARECMADWRAHPLHSEVRLFIGEALGEEHNAPTCDEQGNWHYTVPNEPCERNLIKRAFDVYRGRFDGQDDYAVWNLLEVLKAVRVDLSGEDFSALDLGLCEINGHTLGKRDLTAKLKNAKISEEFIMPKGHTCSVSTAMFSPDGKQIVTASIDGSAKVWDAVTFQEIATLKGIDCHATCSATYSMDGKHIIATYWTSQDSLIKIWDAESFSSVKIIQKNEKYNGEFVDLATSSRDGKYIAFVDGSGSIEVRDSKSFSRIYEKKLHTDQIQTMDFSTDGKIVTGAKREKTAIVWEAETLRKLGVLKHSESVHNASFSPDNKRIITSSLDGTVKIWDALTMQEISSLKRCTSSLWSACYSPDNLRILIAYFDGTVKILHAEKLQEVATLIVPDNRCYSASYSPDATKIVAFGSNNNVYVWDADTLQVIGTLKGFYSGVNTVTYNPKGTQIVMTSNENKMLLYDTRTLRLVNCTRLPKGKMTSVLYSYDGRRILTKCSDHTIYVWNSSTFLKINSFEDYSISSLVSSIGADGKLILTLSKDGRIIIRETIEYKAINSIEIVGDHICAVSYCSNGKKIMALSSKGNVLLFDAESFTRIGAAHINFDENEHAAFFPDQMHIIVAKKLLIGPKVVWETDSFQMINSYYENLLNIYLRENTVAFEPNGKRVLMSIGRGNAIMYYYTKNFKQIGKMNMHKDNIVSIVFSPDCRNILTGSEDDTAKVWDAETFECLHTIHNVPGLEVLGVDFRHLHPDSRLSIETKERLYEYGAIVDDRG